MQFRRLAKAARERHVNWRSSGKGLPTAGVSTSKHGTTAQGRAKCRRVWRAHVGEANYPAGKIPWRMPANGESRGDARSLGVSITFQQDC